MVKYLLKELISAGISFFIPLQGYEKRAEYNAGAKIIVRQNSRRLGGLNCFLKVHFQLLLNCLQMFGK